MPNDMEIIHNRICCISIKNRGWSYLLMAFPVGYAGPPCCSVSLITVLLLIISAKAQQYFLIGPVHCGWAPEGALLCCHAPCCSTGPGSFCVLYPEFLSESNAIAWLRIQTDISHDSFYFICVSTIFRAAK